MAFADAKQIAAKPVLELSSLPINPQDLEKLAISQLEHALDAHRRGLRIYESLKSLNDVIGTQYGDRVLLELVQNAHDAHGTDDNGEIAVHLLIENEARGELLIANRGRGVTDSNLDAIRNIGTSDKEIGEGIGNKGLGFRSVEALTDDVRIYSSRGVKVTDIFDGYCFRFATSDEMKTMLAKLGAIPAIAEIVSNNVPRYLVPLPAPDQPETVRRFAKEGFATVVSLPLTSCDTVKLAKEQVFALASPGAPVLLFLDRISTIRIEVSEVGTPSMRRRLTRKVEPIVSTPHLQGMRMERVTLDDSESLLVVKRTLQKKDVLNAVQASLSAAPPLKRWLNWRGDAVVSVAVSLSGPPISSPRLFNFLPMDERAVAPFAGYLDAPFFADIDRRSIKPDLPLNKYLLEAAAITAADAALTVVKERLPIPEGVVVDLVTWAQQHVQKIVDGFKVMKMPLEKAPVWPIVSGGPSRWASLNALYVWPGIDTRYITPGRLAAGMAAAIISPTLGEARLARVSTLSSALSQSLKPTPEVLCEWSVALANEITESKRLATGRWRQFYDDVVVLFEAVSAPLESLQGKKIFIGTNDKLLIATAEGIAGSPPVFVRTQYSKGRKREGPPSPPASLSKKFRFLKESVDLSDATLRAFEKARLLRRYDPVEVLNGLHSAMGAAPTDTQRREALLWAFRVWRSGGGKQVEDAVRSAKLYVPTLGGWHPASEALLSGSWSRFLGRYLESYLHEGASHSADCAYQRDRLLLAFTEWPKAASADTKDAWLRFLGLLGVVDGLKPIAGKLRRSGTPSNYWNYLFQKGDSRLGLSERWAKEAQVQVLSHPQTEYRLHGEAWRLPGQLEYEVFPQSARESLSELIVVYLREHGNSHFYFEVRHWREWEKVNLPTPLQMFLRDGEWVASLRRDDLSFAAPGRSWSTTVVRQIPPRFVARFAAEPGIRGTLPPILFGPRVGLRDWARHETAPQRLESLAEALHDMSASERRDLRDQLRRAWTDVAEGRLALPVSLPLVVERSGGLELCIPVPGAVATVYVTSERQGFAARALADRGEAVLDVGEADAVVIRELLAATGAFEPRLANAEDIRLVVDDLDFEPSGSDPLLASGNFAWLGDAVALAHEFLGDPLELRTLPPDVLEQKLRAIRLRRCGTFSLLLGDVVAAAGGNDCVQPIPHPRLPTLLVAGEELLDLDLLIEAAPAITKLLGARRNTLETMLGRLIRAGFSGGAAGPSEGQYARAIQRDVVVVRDHFAATRGSMERRVLAMLPAICLLGGRDAADQLLERHERLGSALKLCEWLSAKFDGTIAERLLAATEGVEEQAEIRRRLGFGFTEYNHTLASLGMQPLNDEADFRRLFEVFVNDLRPALLDRIRRCYYAVWKKGEDLSGYVALRQLDFISFDPSWVFEIEIFDREFVAERVMAAAEAAIGQDDPSVSLPDFARLTAANRKLATFRYARLASMVRAWCRKAGLNRPALIASSDPQPLIRALDRAGFMDFEHLREELLPKLCARIGAWPAGMPEDDSLETLNLSEADLEHEVLEAREARRRAEVEKRTIRFVGESLDTGADDFAHLFARIADDALADRPDWLARSRPPRLIFQEQRDGGYRRGGNGSRGGTKGLGWQNQPTEAIRRAMGVASEWLAREYLKRRHPKEMSDSCWRSSNRTFFCSGDEGDDGLGYDFRVLTARNEWLYEVKSSLDEGGEFELTARELEVAGSASMERKRRYRILYVPFVFDPTRWCVLPLSNPAGMETKSKFKVVRSGSVRYRFDIRK